MIKEYTHTHTHTHTQLMDKALTVNARDFGKEVIWNPTLVFYPVQIIDTYLRRNVEGGGGV